MYHAAISLTLILALASMHLVLLNCHFLEQANKENDEVYTQVTLLPQAEVGFYSKLFMFWCVSNLSWLKYGSSWDVDNFYIND